MVVFNPIDFQGFDSFASCYHFCHQVLQEQDASAISSVNGNTYLRVDIALCNEIYSIVLANSNLILLETQPHSGTFYANVVIDGASGLLNVDTYYGSSYRNKIIDPKLRKGSNVVIFLNAICYVFLVSETIIYDDSTIDFVPLFTLRKIAGMNSFYEDLGYQLTSCRYSRQEIETAFNAIGLTTPNQLLQDRRPVVSEDIWNRYKDQTYREIFTQFLKNRDSQLRGFTYAADSVKYKLPQYTSLVLSVSIGSYRKLTSKYDVILYCCL